MSKMSEQAAKITECKKEFCTSFVNFYIFQYRFRAIVIEGTNTISLVNVLKPHY
jgi:hypothetical protein